MKLLDKVLIRLKLKKPKEKYYGSYGGAFAGRHYDDGPNPDYNYHAIILDAATDCGPVPDF